LKVAKIWSEILGIDKHSPIDMEANFYDLGGTSLHLMRLASLLESRLGAVLSIAELMSTPTIKKISRIIDSKNEGWAPLIKLAGESKRKPGQTVLIVVPGVGGSVLYFQEILNNIHPSIHVYALAPFGINKDENIDENIHDMAQRYTNPIIEKFPMENIVLLSWCMGGLTAWELASQLQQSGCMIKDIILLNSRSYLLTDDQGLPVYIDSTRRDVPRDLIDIGLKSLGEYEDTDADISSVKHIRVSEYIRGQLLCWAHYKPSILSVNIHLIRPTDPVDGTFLPFETQSLGWEKLTELNMTSVNVKGDHFSMLKKENADDITRKIESLLERSREIPLTPIQRWFFSLDINHNHFHHSVLLETKEEIDIHDFKKILNFLSQKHEMLRASFTRNGEHPIQKILPASKRGFGIIECEFDEMKDVVKKVSTNMDIAEKPLAWAVLSKGGNNNSAVAFIIHHLVIDHVSWAFLNESFKSALKQLQQNPEVDLLFLDEPDDLIENDGSFSEWSYKINKLSNDPKITSQIAYWKKIVGNPDQEGGFDDGFKPEKTVKIRRFADIENMTLSLDRRQTQVIVQHDQSVRQGDFPQKDNIESNLLSIIVTSLNNMFHIENTLLTMEHHGRLDLFEDFNLAGNIGWFTSTYPLNIQARNNVADNLKEIIEKMNKVPNHGIGYGLLTRCNEKKSLLQETLSYSGDILFNYLGDLTENTNTDSEVNISNFGFENDISNNFIQNEKLNITGYLKAGQLEMNIAYHKEEYSVDKIKKLTEKIKELVSGK